MSVTAQQDDTTTIPESDSDDDQPTVDIGPYARPMNEPYACDECDGPYIMHEGDKMCARCGLLSGSADTEEVDPWEEWREHRDEHYEGWTGEERIKMVGGFASPYFE